jgi:hypothetical protein
MDIKQGAEKKKDRDRPAALFIPAGVLTGMGLGFVFNNLPAGMFIGLGVGFAVFGVVEIVFGVKKNRD